MTIFSSLYGTRLDEELGTDDSTVLFTTARRKRAINRGAFEFANLTQCLERRATFTVTGGTFEYDLNSTVNVPGGDFNQFSPDGLEFRYTDAAGNVTILSGRDQIPRRDMDWLNQYQSGWQLSTVAAGTMQLPAYHYVRQDGPAFWLGFTPVPSSGSSASMSVSLSYIAQAPTMVNDADQPFTFNSSVRLDLNTYHQALVHYGAHQLEKLRRDDQASDRQYQKFLQYAQRYFSDMRIKGGRQIRQARSYFTRKSGANWGNALAWPWTNGRN